VFENAEGNQEIENFEVKLVDEFSKPPFKVVAV